MSNRKTIGNIQFHNTEPLTKLLGDPTKNEMSMRHEIIKLNPETTEIITHPFAASCGYSNLDINRYP